MDPERWRRAERLFHVALERAPADRPVFLDEACGSDVELRGQVERLLASDREAGGFLETPVLPVFATDAAAGSLVGRELGQYRVESLLGAGGMGEVYRAHDPALGRDVAIKTLPAHLARDPERLSRLRREARTLASLNHPNIGAVYGLEEAGDLVYLVLELVEGEALRGPLPIAAALERAGQVAEALQAAHEHGIVHRDLKPANIRVTPAGRIKVLDFGLAKVIEPAASASGPSRPASSTDTIGWQVVGTPGYMSPEQVRGSQIDRRTDIWAFGCLLFELLSGKRAFEGRTTSDAIAAVLGREPDWHQLPRGLPPRLRGLIARCLAKDVNLRPDGFAEIRSVLRQSRRAPGHWRSLASAFRRPWIAVAAIGLVLLLVVLGGRLWQRFATIRQVRAGVPEIAHLFDVGEMAAAYRLVRRAEAVLPDDPAIRKLHLDHTLPVSIETNPAGAEVWATGYAPEDEAWVRLGVTPLTTAELPVGVYRFRVAKTGFEEVSGSGEVRGGTSLRFDLDRQGTLPPDMVRVPGGRVVVPGLDAVPVEPFLVDRYEVTNRQFKALVESGGYERPEYWKQAFARDGKPLSWAEAMTAFRDRTGRAGPSTWELGGYPMGHDDHPVSGVSWYEAAAYAEFAGKRLPTIYQWQKAGSPGWFAEPVGVSNFGTGGPRPVGANGAIGPFGAFDLAGNVREWCWNEAGGRRSVRGGAWDEPEYMFATLDAVDPWDRSARNGFRCVREDVKEQPALRAPVAKPVRDVRQEKPVPDAEFRVISGLYAYDPTPLDPRVEGVDDETSYWRRERVSFAATYGSERVSGYLYLPKRARPPYQAIIYAHPGMSLRLPALEPGEQGLFDFLPKSGRAFLVPVLKGHYQRRYPAPPAGPNDVRDRLILESKDFRRSVEYLASRADIDRERLGAYGLSRGYLLPILAVGERRLAAAVVVSVGLPSEPGVRPEADSLNFLPRFEVPTLMVCGRFDFMFPVETSQRPMFRLLAAPEADKRLVHWDGGHYTSDARLVVKETLDWFDRYLGPVRPSR